MRKWFFRVLLACFFCTAFLLPRVIIAQSNNPDLVSLGVAQSIDLQGTDISDGMVVTFKENKYAVSTTAYDPYIAGILVKQPALGFYYSEDAEKTGNSMLTSGTTRILVTAKNGPIAVGDRLTSSDIAGTAMVANKSGITLGIAQEAFSPANPDDTGLIVCTIDIKFALSRELTDKQKVGSKLLDVANLSTLAALENPQDVLKYVLAAVILIGSITFSFLTFGRAAQNSILALGRNPLASKAISIGMVLNISLAIIVVIGGVLTAWFVINL